MRLVIVGVTGSGKSTLAAAVSARLRMPHVELDALHWEPNWRMAELQTFRARVSQALAGEAWVADGNYSKARDLIWARAQGLVWLDYPLWLVLARLTRRTVRRVMTQELLWGTNRERLGPELFSKDSLFSWALQTHPRYRREFPVLLQSPEYGHLKVTRLRSPREAHVWLERLQPVAA